MAALQPPIRGGAEVVSPKPVIRLPSRVSSVRLTVPYTVEDAIDTFLSDVGDVRYEWKIRLYTS